MNLDKMIELVKSVKSNPTVLAGIVITSIGAIGTGAYNGITYYNEMKSMVTGYSETASTANSSNRKVDALIEKVNAQQEAIMKLQERSSDALVNAREAKMASESTQREVRSLAAAQQTELKAMNESMNSQLNAIKRATTNRLGN
jgi:hypothetical protein